MKLSIRLQILLAITLLVAVSGCSALPGLRVLSGQDSPDALADQVAELTDMVMADKSGTTDPALLAAADRIEQANGGTVDIIEIRKDVAQDIFNVDLLWMPDNITTTAEYYDAIRRVTELTWQGTMQASQGADVVNITILLPTPVPTLDKGGSFAGVIFGKLSIPRSDAVAYLAHRPTNLSDFVNLIAEGKIQYDELKNGQQPEYYSGEPNHPMFMLAQLEAQARSQQGQQPSQ
jgi:hypothetical protein